MREAIPRSSSPRITGFTSLFVVSLLIFRFAALAPRRSVCDMGRILGKATAERA